MVSLMVSRAMKSPDLRVEDNSKPSEEVSLVVIANAVAITCQHRASDRSKSMYRP